MDGQTRTKKQKKEDVNGAMEDVIVLSHDSATNLDKILTL